MGGVMDLTYAEWFDRVAPAINWLESSGYVFAPETRRDAAMTAMGNQHRGARTAHHAMVDSIHRNTIARPGQYFAVSPVVEYRGQLDG